VTSAREWAGHRFSDDEVARLPAGETIEFSATAQNGKAYEIYGELGESIFKGRKFVGFHKAGFAGRDADGQALPPKA
jgi:DNA topoisomerase III